MGGCYTPPCIYGMNEWFANRVQNQGISVFETVLGAELATAVLAGDDTAATVFGSLIQLAQGELPNFISLPPLRCVATTAWMIGSPTFATMAVVGKVSDWAYGVASITLGVAAHATDP